MATLPHLKPVHGVRQPAAFSNLTLVHPPLKGAAERKAAAAEELKAEVRLKRKIDQTSKVLDSLDVRDKAIASAIKQLQRRRADNAARIERIEDAALTLMSEAGLSSVTGFHSSFRAQPAASALEVIDQSKIPAEYLRQPKTPPPEPDKVAIKKALGANDELDPAAWGCKLTSKISLVRR
jgi:hypothetical protein